MTTIQVINQATFQEQYGNKVGSLMFPDEWYNCLSYVNKTKLRKNIKDKLPKGARIIGVLIATQSNPNFKNIVNEAIPYETAVCADKDQAGAYYKTYEGMTFSCWVSDFPVGDAIVVYK